MCRCCAGGIAGFSSGGHISPFVIDAKDARTDGFGGYFLIGDKNAGAEDAALADVFGQLGIHTHDDVLQQPHTHRLVHRPQEGRRDSFLYHLGAAHRDFKRCQRVFRTGAVTPNAEAVLADQGSDFVVIEDVGLTVFV